MSESIWIRRMQADMGFPKPVLRWNGGRRCLVREIIKRLPGEWNRYFEPFGGGFSLFFALYREERIEEATLGDSNYDLMDTYRVVRKYPDDVLEFLAAWRRSRERFEELCLVRRTSQWEPEDAARFIYLNQCCHKGLYQVNEMGEFVVPYGKHTDTQLYDEENVRAASLALQRVLLFTGKYSGCLRDAEKGDFVYLDPPRFGPWERKALVAVLDCLNKKRVKWLVTVPDAARFRAYNVDVLNPNGVIVRNY